MKNHRFLWLRNRTTNNRKCEKARNIKEKRTIEMFSTVSNPLVAHHSSANVNFSIKRTYKREDNKPRKIKIFRGFLYILTRKDFLQVFRNTEKRRSSLTLPLFSEIEKNQ